MIPAKLFLLRIDLLDLVEQGHTRTGRLQAATDEILDSAMDVASLERLVVLTGPSLDVGDS